MAEPQRRAAVVRRSSCADSGPQAKRQRYTSDASIVVPTQRPGKILQVTLKNFMCHENLEIKLNESVNFITGENGSGKSAVLTAIMVGLGSRAKGTDRGSSLPALIRNGQSSAEVTVKLCNTGELAYKKDLYGDAIFVKRTIRKDGSSFSIKSAAGKKIASKGKDLEGILDALNIQTDNPITVLTQDTSKTFLFVNDPRKKYQLFLRATRLKHIMDDYESIDRNLRSAEDSLDTKREGLCEGEGEGLRS
ncbi:structural maintenance of chromosomes protein 6-like [Pollicipes pollicipes]|uniref:structural maintenance of chromosomes protein 6-like n=1 Tax=Pollicipes pollicipes TaxID=41117 RepID=UPI0018858C8D|nr:structural maintenance of chromosomes protein 6-like [Pollicipes pollicipes]